MFFTPLSSPAGFVHNLGLGVLQKLKTTYKSQSWNFENSAKERSADLSLPLALLLLIKGQGEYNGAVCLEFTGAV